MYHAARKVELQPFKRSYSQLTFFNFSLKIYQVLGGVRRVGLTPALAPRMPVITEDVLID